MSYNARFAMQRLDWYFDFISPYSHLQNAVLARVAPLAAIRRRPVLFGGLLGHWGQLGPAEIVPKRAWTFHHCAWLAARHGIALRMPTMHPFNPLPLLRLSIALDDRADVVDRLFAFVWVDGHVPTDRRAWTDLLDELGTDEAALQADAVKQALRANGDDALAAGVFGVPSAVVDGHCFWGFEATDMLLDYLRGTLRFDDGPMRAAAALPLGPMRPRVAGVAS